MSDWIRSHGISMPVAIAIIVLGVVQLTLQIWGLVDLLRRPAPGQRKAVFATVIVLLGLVGALAYLVVGRSMLDEEASAGSPGGGGGGGGGTDETARQRAIDQLYGPDQRK